MSRDNKSASTCAYALLGALCLSACSPQVRLATVPDEYRSCADWPAPPDMPAWDWASIEIARAIARQRDALSLAYEQDGFLAHGSCKAVVAGVNAWAEEVEQ